MYNNNKITQCMCAFFVSKRIINKIKVKQFETEIKKWTISLKYALCIRNWKKNHKNPITYSDNKRAIFFFFVFLPFAISNYVDFSVHFVEKMLWNMTRYNRSDLYWSWKRNELKSSLDEIVWLCSLLVTRIHTQIYTQSLTLYIIFSVATVIRFIPTW